MADGARRGWIAPIGAEWSKPFDMSHGRPGVARRRLQIAPRQVDAGGIAEHAVERPLGGEYLRRPCPIAATNSISW